MGASVTSAGVIYLTNVGFHIPNMWSILGIPAKSLSSLWFLTYTGETLFWGRVLKPPSNFWNTNRKRWNDRYFANFPAYPVKFFGFDAI